MATACDRTGEIATIAFSRMRRTYKRAAYDETPELSRLPLRDKMRNTRSDQMLSASIPNSDIARHPAVRVWAQLQTFDSFVGPHLPDDNSRMHPMRELPVVPICRMASRLRRRANHNDPLAHPVSMKRDVSADRHDTWGGDAMDADGTSDERGLRGRRSRVVLALRCRR
jgi:hypothetical protein